MIERMSRLESYVRRPAKSYSIPKVSSERIPVREANVSASLSTVGFPVASEAEACVASPEGRRLVNPDMEAGLR